jgi:hypothetical protein
VVQESHASSRDQGVLPARCTDLLRARGRGDEVRGGAVRPPSISNGRAAALMKLEMAQLPFHCLNGLEFSSRRKTTDVWLSGYRLPWRWRIPATFSELTISSPRPPRKPQNVAMRGSSGLLASSELSITVC